MNTEETIVELNGLIQTCRDGELGYGAAATDVRNTELETVFTGYAKQRGQFVRNLQAEVKRLGKAQEALTTSAMKLLMWFQSGQLEIVPLVANRFLDMMSELSVAWLLLLGGAAYAVFAVLWSARKY